MATDVTTPPLVIIGIDAGDPGFIQRWAQAVLPARVLLWLFVQCHFDPPFSTSATGIIRPVLADSSAAATTAKLQYPSQKSGRTG
jgi:hypothetical protein